MERSILQTSQWYLAQTLTELIRAKPAIEPKFLQVTANHELAEKRLESWKSQAPFDKDSYLTQRLATENMTEEEFLNILGESTETLRDRFSHPPAWLIELEQAFSRTPATEPMNFPAALKEIETIGFLEIIEPLISQGRDRLAQGICNLIQTYPNLPFDPDTIENLLFINLPRRLLMRLSRTLVLELNVARLQGLLSGDTPQERFQSFIERLRQRDVALSILEEYPVLARQLTICIDRWVAVSLEFLQHLCGDWKVIQAQFGDRPNPPSSLPCQEKGKTLAPLSSQERGWGRGQPQAISSSLSARRGKDLTPLAPLPYEGRGNFPLASSPVRGAEVEVGLLTEVNFGAGDSHRDGRSVVIAKFSSGFEIVYKPRSLSLDVHFQELLQWINDRGEHPPFRTLNICDRGTYGWVEFVAAQTCTSKAEIERFYQRQGAYLAILYALEATDFHHENLIAVGEHPILLDLEALFHPRVEGADLKQAHQLANSTLGYSVYGIGLLPHRIWSSDESEGIDISGLGGAAGQLTPHQVPRWEGTGTDEMKLTRQRVELQAAQNQPTLNGEKVNVLDYAEAIASGFTNVYRLLLQHREELLAENSPLANFAEDTVRVIVRATRTYAMLLSESFHPDMLRNALDRDRLFDRLWLAVEHLPHLAQLIPAEREDLLAGDIPMFTARPASRDIWTSSGWQIPNFLDRSGLISARDRLRQLSETDLERQLWIIRASLASLELISNPASKDRSISLASGSPLPKKKLPFPSPRRRGQGEVGEGLGVRAGFKVLKTGFGIGTEEPKKHSNYQPHQLPTIADRDRLLAAARAVGDRLESLALLGDGEASWIGLTLLDQRHWSIAPLGYDLYDGLPGVILFLAHLGKIAKAERYTELARAACKTWQYQLEKSNSWISQVGAFSGWGGIIYTLIHLGSLWQQPELITQAESFVELLPPLIERDTQFDIIGGAAGCLSVLLNLDRTHPNPKTLAAAIQCGDRLLEQAESMEEGCGWVIRGMGAKPLAGFSHGNAGIAWALLELAAVSGEERFRQVALDAIAYERSIFSVEAFNWPDLREFESSVLAGNKQPASFMSAWCHGAPGIGLARLQCLPYLDDADIRTEIDIALMTTVAQGFGRNHSLCHGDLGNLELLLQASEILGESQWRYQVERLAAIVLASIERDGWLCGIPLGVESPGLMTGLAGIGYGLLRLAAPTSVPTILGLAPPVHQSERVQGLTKSHGRV
jgi:lantibiotic modifying enzyme